MYKIGCSRVQNHQRVTKSKQIAVFLWALCLQCFPNYTSLEAANYDGGPAISPNSSFAIREISLRRSTLCDQICGPVTERLPDQRCFPGCTGGTGGSLSVRSG